MPNLAKRLLIAIIIDISPSTGFKGALGSKTSNEMINQKLKSMIVQLCKNAKVRSAAEVCFVLYSSEVEVKPFVPLKTLENNVPEFAPVESGGTRTATAVKAAYDALHKRASEIDAMHGSLYTSIAILLTDGDISLHDSEDTIRNVTDMVNECTLKKSRAEKVLPIIVGLGDDIAESTKKMLAGLSKGLVDDGFFQIHNSTDAQVDDDLTKLFRFFSSSIVRSVSADSVDVLLDELRSLVQEVYGETVCHVND